MIQECNFYYLSIEFNLDGIRELLMTSTKTEVLTDSLENVAQSLVSKGEIQKVRFIDSGVPVGPWLVMLHVYI